MSQTDTSLTREDLLRLASQKTEKVRFPSGATSSKVPRLELIPFAALCRLAARFELGIERHGDDAWNALSKQECLRDREFAIARAGHVMHHAARLIAKLTGRIPDDGDDDAAAVMWGGAFLCEATAALRRPCAGCSGTGQHAAGGPDGKCPACKGSGVGSGY